MSLAFEVAKTVLHAEEVARLAKPVVIESKAKNNVYIPYEIPLTVEHKCYSIDIPTYAESINFVTFYPCDSEYKYRINHGEWITVSVHRRIFERNFNISSIDISNTAGLGVLKIHLEGVREESLLI